MQLVYTLSALDHWLDFHIWSFPRLTDNVYFSFPYCILFFCRRSLGPLTALIHQLMLLSSTYLTLWVCWVFRYVTMCSLSNHYTNSQNKISQNDSTKELNWLSLQGLSNKFVIYVLVLISSLYNRLITQVQNCWKKSQKYLYCSL